MPKVPDSGLTAKERSFVAHFLLVRNQTEAAIRAGYSPHTAQKIGSEVAQRERVKKALADGMRRLNEKVETSAEKTLAEITRLAMFDPASLIGVTCAEDIALLPEDARRAIVGWGYDRQGRFMIKLAKEGALEMLAKHHGLYEADNRQRGELLLKKSAADMSDEELAIIARQHAGNT